MKRNRTNKPSSSKKVRLSVDKDKDVSASSSSDENEDTPLSTISTAIPFSRIDELSSFSFWKNLRLREQGHNFKTSSIKVVSKLDRRIVHYKNKTHDQDVSGCHGAVFNLEFSPDNKYLVAACENKDVLIYDPCDQNQVNMISEAHTDGVNCITFLDTRTFATCSDDKTIALWDIRNLNSKTMTLEGHESWVKSMNYHPGTGKLISSAFDDTVRIWNINDYHSGGNTDCKKILNVPYLTRTKLSTSSDGTSKLIVATTTGVLFVIHNLKLDTLRTDTQEELKSLSSIFKNLNPKNPAKHKSSRTYNRLEFIQEFPSTSKPWCIASIQIHPTNDSILSRYTTLDTSSEWSAVHAVYEQDSSQNYKLESYIEELNSTHGYIKELCYNNDGRLIFSPFGFGVRMLSQRNNQQLCESGNWKASTLEEIKILCGHKNTVLTTRCAPYFPMVASGCLSGKVAFYQPKF